MTKKIQLYHFGDYGQYDEQSPLYLYEQKWASELLYMIANANPYQLTLQDIAKRLNIETNEIESLLGEMVAINMISMKDNRYSVEFTIFLEKDLPLIDEYSKLIAYDLGRKIVEHKDEITHMVSKLSTYNKFDLGRLLYHVIGCSIFDGTAMDAFGERGIFSVSKEQSGKRDYLLFGFEDSEKVEAFSDGLLCSCNNHRTEKVTFLSFGDSNGNRKDLYRFFRQVNSHLREVTKHNGLNLAYIKTIDEYNKRLANRCADLIVRISQADVSTNAISVEEENALDLLQELGYIEVYKDGGVKIVPPLFTTEDEKIIEEVSNLVLGICTGYIADALAGLKIKMPMLSAVQHGIDEKEIANELWHQVFGNVNEYLVKEGFFAKPKHRDGEGRYFQALYIS